MQPGIFEFYGSGVARPLNVRNSNERLVQCLINTLQRDLPQPEDKPWTTTRNRGQAALQADFTDEHKLVPTFPGKDLPSAEGRCRATRYWSRMVVKDILGGGNKAGRASQRMGS